MANRNIKTGSSEPEPSFEEQMRAAEEAAGIPPDNEFYSEFSPAEAQPEEPQPVEAEPVEEPVEEELPAAAEAEAEPIEPEPEPEPEDAPDPLAEVNKKLGQLLNDNAELRRQNEQLAQPEVPQPQQQLPLTDVGWFDEFADGDPQQAAVWALQNQQTHLYDRAVRSWHDQDPVAAGRFERQLEQAAMLQNMQQSIQPQIQAAQEVGNRAQLEEAMSSVAARHDDFAEVMGTMTPDTVENILSSGLPVQILEQGLQGDLQQKEQVFETLYRWQKADVAGQLALAAKDAPARTDEEARAAKRDAFVGSATTTTPDEVPMTEQERLEQAWATEDRSLRKGWKGQESRRPVGR